jgi:hypothetical protein
MTDNWISPYKMDYRDVKPEHFKDARVYGNSKPGWEVPREQARLAYQNWVKSVRNTTGQQNFRRNKEANVARVFHNNAIPSYDEEEETED